MAQSLAHRNAHLALPAALVAVLLALAAALFIAWPSASAADQGNCKPGKTRVTELEAGDTCRIAAGSGQVLRHTYRADRLVAEMTSGGEYPSGRAAGLRADYVATGNVTVTARLPGEITIVNQKGSGDSDNVTYNIRVAGDGQNMGVCSPGSTQYLLPGDYCRLHENNGAQLTHLSADGTPSSDRSVVKLVADSDPYYQGQLKFGAYGTGDGENTFTVAGHRSGWDSTGSAAREYESRNFILLQAVDTGAATIKSGGKTYKFEVISEPQFEIDFLNDSDGIIEAGDVVHVGVRALGVVRGQGYPVGLVAASGAGSDAIAIGDDRKFVFGPRSGTFGDYTVELSVPSTGLRFGTPNDEYTDGPATASGSYGSKAVDRAWTAYSKGWSPNLGQGFKTTSQVQRLRMVDLGLIETAATQVPITSVAYLVTDGAQQGEYTISAKVRSSDLRPDAVGRLDVGYTITKTVTIVTDAGQPLSSVELSLAPDYESVAGQGSSIKVVLAAKNSLGNPANAADLTSIIVSAPGAWISHREGREKHQLALDEDDGLKEEMTFTVTSAAEGQVSVTATVAGRSSAQTSKALTLTFGGKAKSVVLGAASGRLGTAKTTDANKNRVTIEVTGKDASGQKASVKKSALRASVKDAAGTAKHLRVKLAQGKTGTGDDAKDDVHTVIATVEVTDAKVAPGTYTLEVTLGGQSTTKQTAKFSVSGPAASIVVSANKSTVSLGEIVVVTAKLMDKDGNPAQDSVDADVSFAAAGNLNLLSFGATKGSVKAKGGEASMRFLVTGGSGTAAVLVSQGDVTGIVSIREATGVTTATLNCLSAMAKFATWTCASEVTASRVFRLLSGHGASALLLWDGSAWKRYSVVNGKKVPGSNDFKVSEYSIIYISS